MGCSPDRGGRQPAAAGPAGPPLPLLVLRAQQGGAANPHTGGHQRTQAHDRAAPRLHGLAGGHGH